MRSISCITPPHLLKKLLESDDREIREAALNTLLSTAHLRGEREVRGASGGFLAAPSQGRRTIYDCRGGIVLPQAIVARTEDGDPSVDEAVNRAFEGFGETRAFLKEVFNRSSLDDRGMRLDGYVHRGRRYNNAFWDGQEMVFGDGDGVIFTDFTESIDVIAHELGHGVTEFTANLEYRGQSGALNESMSDVLGSLVKQWSLDQSALDADWLIGAEIFTPRIGGDALRSMKEPGKAYDNADLGNDPQPDHMDRYEHLPETEDGDWGGVHINSGIPNKAFYLVAVSMGGYAWDSAGVIWYQSLLASHPNTQFQEFAETTCRIADQLFDRNHAQTVADAWREVGIRVATVGARGRRQGSGKGAPKQRISDDPYAELASTMEALSEQLRVLTKEVKSLKKA